MNNKGFSLTECVVAIGVVVLIGLISLSSCLFFVSYTNKSLTRQIGLNEIENIVKIIKTTNCENEGVCDFQKLQDNLYDYNKIVVELNEEVIKNGCMVEIHLDSNATNNEKGHIHIEYKFSKVNEYFNFGAILKYKDKVVYQNEMIFQKLIRGWM